MEKKLYKINEGKKICGVCGGLAEYLNLDVSIVRILWVLAALLGSVGFWLYIACALILPEKPSQIENPDNIVDAE